MSQGIDVTNLMIERGMLGGWVLKAQPSTPDAVGERLIRAYSSLDELLAGLKELLGASEGG